MKKVLTILSISLIQFIFSVTVFAQKLELTPTIQSHTPGNKSAVIVKKQSKDAKIGGAISSGTILKSAATDQINYQWGKYFSTYNNDRLYKTVIDAFGNIIAVGSNGESSSDVDAVIYKYDSSGNFLWSETPAISSDYDGIYGVVTDKTGNIYVTGKFYSSAFNYQIYSYGDADIFIAKYDPDGNLLWAKNAGGTDNDYGSNIGLDDTGNLYVVGFYNGIAYWDDITKTSSNQGDMFIAKYDNNGNAKWVRTGDIGAANWLSGIGVDKSGNTYVNFNFSGEAQFEGGPVISSNGITDVFLIKYDSSGNFQWIKTAGGTGDDGGNDTNVDPDGNVLIAGWFSDVAHFDNVTLTAHGIFDIFCAKYSPSGSLIWTKQFGGNGSQTAWTVASDEKSNCYVSGWFSGTGAFDNTTIISSGGSDAYLIKYDKNGNLIWVEPTALGLDKQVGSGVSVKGNDLSICGYYEGEMNIQNNYFLNEGGEDAYLAKLFQSNVNLPNFIVNPSFTLSALQINQGQSITLIGAKFSPIGKVDLQFSGPDKFFTVTDQPIDINGNFQYTYTTSSSIEKGDYTVNAIDKISGKTYSRTFRVISEQTNTVDTDLKIVEPNTSKIRYTNDPLLFAWQDKVKFNINPIYNYKHSYTVSVQEDNGMWQLFTKVEGTNNGFGDLSLSINFSPSQPGKYKLKVEDNYYPNRSAVTPDILIESQIIDNISVDFVWDRSYPIPANNPKLVGVSADGVARFKMVISNANLLSAEIQKVKVSLFDPDNYMAPRYLGKVKYCAIQNNNSSSIDFDANDANSILTENYSKNDDGKYWFWYVAPEDFARNQGDWNNGIRQIIINVEVILTDGKKYLKQKNIEIVRPPLLLVHGLNGDKDTWQNFQIGTGNPLYNDAKESRFKVIHALDMFPNSYFSDNSDQLLDGISNNRSFSYWINKLREQGYACNQLDYLCHSMGGSILRDAVDKKDRFYRNNNYQEGFVHKFITLNTPHQGSSFANFLVDIDDDPFGLNWILQGKLGERKLFECAKMKCVVKDAIRDLRYFGGIKFSMCNIPSHMIGGCVSCTNYPQVTTDILHQISMVTNKIKSKDLCSSLDEYFTENGFESDFVENNDGIVSIESQFSGNKLNNLLSNCSFYSGLMHNSEFGDSPTRSEDVFDKVNELLNSSLGSSLFMFLPSTDIVNTKSAKNLDLNNIEVDENKISILYPSTKLDYYAGDTMHIKLQVDTIGLKSFAIYFQDQSIYTMPSDTIVFVKLTINPEYIEQQNIVIIGNYQIAGQASISTVNENIKVNPIGPITEFNVKPEVIVIQKGKSSRPNYEAVFPDAISEIGNTNLITAIIKDPNVLSYDTEANSFTGLAAGITNANITYRGKSKTVFFEVLEPVTPIVDPPTGLNDFRMDKTDPIKFKVYPNPVTNELTIELEGNVQKVDFEIINTLGQTVYSGSLFEKIVVPTTSFISGMYVIKLKSGKTYEFKKFVKE